jgi:hypothetical protein
MGGDALRPKDAKFQNSKCAVLFLNPRSKFRREVLFEKFYPRRNLTALSSSELTPKRFKAMKNLEESTA